MNSKNLLFGILVIIALIIGFVVGRFSSVGSTVPSGEQATTEQGVENTEGEGTQIPASTLTEGQKKMLAAFGIDPNSITITPQMMACAESSLGATRLDEITNGATPSLAEGVKLVACYK